MRIHTIALICEFSTGWIGDIGYFAGWDNLFFRNTVFLFGQIFQSLVVAIECYIFIQITN